jgi:hypothetical protein
MIDAILLYIGSGVIFLWGVAHLIPTRTVVEGFGDISTDNRRVVTMTWAAEGLTLCFLGILVFLFTALVGPNSQASLIAYYSAAAMLVAAAVLSAFTGARTSVLPMKICPFVKTGTAVLFVLGSLL